MSTTHDDLFAPPQHQWRPISPKWRDLRRITCWIPSVIVAVPLIVLFVVFSNLWWLWAPLLVLVILPAVWTFARADRYWRSWGYAELNDDLYITHGLMFRKLTIVPYGRMQVVEVESGPIERALGLATVTLVTASAGTNATIVGLPQAEATELRDRLTERAEARTSGL